MSEYTATAHKCQVQLNISPGTEASAPCMGSPPPSSSCATASEWVACQVVIVSFTGFTWKLLVWLLFLWRRMWADGRFGWGFDFERKTSNYILFAASRLHWRIFLDCEAHWKIKITLCISSWDYITLAKYKSKWDSEVDRTTNVTIMVLHISTS